MRRNLRPELMDAPSLDPRQHSQALRGLERVNRLSGSAGLLWAVLRRACAASERPLRVLDIATGAGDVPAALWRRAKDAGMRLEIEACDRSPVALAHARERARASGAGIRFFEWDFAAQGVPPGYDATISSLFLHHLSDEQAERLLREMAAASRRMALVNDLVRSLGGYLAVRAAGRLLTSSRVFHHDGPQSVRAAFTLPEVRTLADRAGLTGAKVASRWPFRFLLVWRRP